MAVIDLERIVELEESIARHLNHVRRMAEPGYEPDEFDLSPSTTAFLMKIYGRELEDLASDVIDAYGKG